jgi:ketosteroid isomerase-like protein
MASRLFFVSILLFSSLSFTYPQQNNDAVTEVKKALEGQIHAWNEGDLEKAMTYYWNSPEILWINKAGIQKGYQPVLEDFRKEFGDKTKMGVYSYNALHIEEVSTAVVYFVFRWKIELNGKRIMGGISSQIWKKIDNRWVVTAEHAS